MEKLIEKEEIEYANTLLEKYYEELTKIPNYQDYENKVSQLEEKIRLEDTSEIFSKYVINSMKKHECELAFIYFLGIRNGINLEHKLASYDHLKN